MAIPKIIHQIWLQGFGQLPEKFKSNVQSVIDKNPDWEHIEWDDNSIRELVKSIGQQYLDKYDSFKLLHQKVDFGRYAILYVKGGVSVDIDVVAIKGFDELPNLETSNLIVSNLSNNRALNNATILASPKNPILLGLLNYILILDCTSAQSNFTCIQKTTGPDAFNKYLRDYKDQITTLDSSYFESCSGYNDYCELNPNAILDHQHEGTWLPESFKSALGFYHWMKEHKWILILIGILLLILILRKCK